MTTFNVIKLNATTSTNDHLKNMRSNRDCKDGDLVWTKNQTRGRGQGDKSWQSENGKSLAISIYRAFNKNVPKHPFVVSSAIATAVIKALDELGIPELSVKWPNDILSCNKKIGGILIENTYKYAQLNETIIGLGLNINQENFISLPNAGSLFTITNEKWDITNVLNSLIKFFERALFSDFSVSEETNLFEFNSYLWRKNKASSFKGCKEVFMAIPLGLTNEGKLIISNLDDGLKKEIDLEEARMLYIHK